MADSQNPLREGLRMERTPGPNTVVIFGASGDLTKRKLLPALHNLELERLLPNSLAVVGFAHVRLRAYHQHPVRLGYGLFHELWNIIARAEVPLVKKHFNSVVYQPAGKRGNPSFVFLGVVRI